MKNVEEYGFIRGSCNKYIERWKTPNGKTLAHISRNRNGPTRWTHYLFSGIMQNGGYKYETRDQAYNALIMAVETHIEDPNFFPDIRAKPKKHITQLYMRNKRTNPFHRQGRF